MRAFVPALFMFAVVVAAGCGQAASPVGPSALVANAQAVVAGQAVSSAAASLNFEIAGTIEGTYKGQAPPPLVPVRVTAEGNASHLGRFTFDSLHVVDFSTFHGEGSADLIFPNGDRITATLSGDATDAGGGVFSIVEHLVVTGGTGRFEGATGQLTLERLSLPTAIDEGTTTGNITGTLSIPRGR